VWQPVFWQQEGVPVDQYAVGVRVGALVVPLRVRKDPAGGDAAADDAAWFRSLTQEEDAVARFDAGLAVPGGPLTPKDPARSDLLNVAGIGVLGAAVWVPPLGIPSHHHRDHIAPIEPGASAAGIDSNAAVSK
jgi:hypothetical protein